MADNSSDESQNSSDIQGICYLPTVPNEKPRTFKKKFVSYVDELNEKVLSLDEYRQKLKKVNNTPKKNKKCISVSLKPKKDQNIYEEQSKQNKTKRAIKNYYNALGQMKKENKKGLSQNPYLLKLLEKKREVLNKRNKSTIPSQRKELSSELPSINQYTVIQDKNIEELPPIPRNSNSKNMNFVSNTSLDQILGDTSLIFFQSQIPSHIKQKSYAGSLTNVSDLLSNNSKLSHQLRKLDYENNKVNTMLKTEKNTIMKMSLKMNKKFKSFHWKYLMSDNEKELLPENHYQGKLEEGDSENVSTNNQLGRMINSLKAVHSEEAKEIIQKNYNKGKDFLMKRIKEERNSRMKAHEILDKSKKMLQGMNK